MSHVSRADIKAMALELSLDEQATGLMCPQCRGGASGEKSFSIRKGVTSAGYFCHRASCDLRGTVNLIGTLGSGPLSTAPARPKKLSDYAGKLVALPNRVEEYLQDKYSLDVLSMRRNKFMWSPDWDQGGGRLAMPIIDRLDGRVGWVFRTLLPKVTPKSINMLTSAEKACVSFYPWTGSNTRMTYMLKQPIVIVEDIISAVRASHVCNAMALLGTNMSEGKLSELQKTRATEVIVALDEDAKDKAAIMVRQLQGLFESVTIRVLSRDLKDMSQGEIRKVLDVDKAIA